MSRTSIFQALRSREESRIESEVPAAFPEYRPTYQNKLRLIGNHLDRNGMRSVKILEVPGGLLARVTAADGATEELLEFPDGGFEGLFDEAVRRRDQTGDEDGLRIKSAIIPTSYEDVLRALGAQLDDWAARSILISEGQATMFVNGFRLENNSMRSALAPFDEHLSPMDVDAILNEAYKRRRSPA